MTTSQLPTAELTEDERDHLLDEATEYGHDHFFGDMEKALEDGSRENARLEALIDNRMLWLENKAHEEKEKELRTRWRRGAFGDTAGRCLICGNTDQSYLTTSHLVIYGQPKTNPDPDGLAGYDPLEGIGRVKINACLLCIAELQTGRAAIVSLADSLAYEDALAVERSRGPR